MASLSLQEKFNRLTLESDNHWDYRGTNNSERDYVHGFCTYPAMMVPKMQRELLDFCLNAIDCACPTLLDPFAGSGTILVEGMLRGLNVVGLDVNPLAILLCKAKTSIVDPDELSKRAESLFSNIETTKEVSLHSFKGIEKWFTKRAITDLSRIRSAILKENDVVFRRFFWATFCEIVRLVSNSRDCTYKLHIKEQNDITAYDKDAVVLYRETLLFNIEKYLSFYQALKERGYIKRDGISYTGKVTIVLCDSINYLSCTKRKYDLVLTSPPYGDNHTTVSYGQYSILPLRWIESKDIDPSLDDILLSTLYEIDNQSLGGKSSQKTITRSRKRVLSKSEMLKKQVDEILVSSPAKANKVVAFYSDYDHLLHALSKKMKPGAISVWTLGNRKVLKQEVLMNKIMIELCEHYHMQLLTSFTRQILNKRMPKLNGYQGEEKGLQSTMTREHILIFVRSDSKNE